MYKACIFDLDGTLADTVESIAYVANVMLERFGLPKQPVEDFNYYAGDGADELVKRCLTAAGDQKLIHWEEGKQIYREMFYADPLYKVKPYEGMVDTLQRLKERGVKLAVFSNKPHIAAVNVIETLFGKGCFDVIQGQTEGIPKKPDPTGALHIAEGFAVIPAECMYVGDTDTDMKTGLAAGMLTIGVTWGFRDRRELEENHAQQIIDRPEELLDIQGEDYYD